MFLNGDPNKLQNGYKVKTIFNKFDIYYIIDKRPWESFCVKCTCRIKYTAIKIFGVQDELRYVMLLLLAKPTFILTYYFQDLRIPSLLTPTTLLITM